MGHWKPRMKNEKTMTHSTTNIEWKTRKRRNEVTNSTSTMEHLHSFYCFISSFMYGGGKGTCTEEKVILQWIRLIVKFIMIRKVINNSKFSLKMRIFELFDTICWRRKRNTSLKRKCNWNDKLLVNFTSPVQKGWGDKNAIFTYLFIL